MRSSLNVILIRHGERADDILKRQGATVPKEEKLDPLLSGEGFQQARMASEAVFKALSQKKRKICLTVAPTRRTCGSALMASVALRDNQQLDFAYREETDGVPIVVINGLSACATQIRKQGPISKLLHAKKLPCASRLENFDSKETPMINAMRHMQEKAIDQTNLSSLSLARVQFCGVNRETNCVEPMTPAITAVAMGTPSHLPSPRPYRTGRPLDDDETWMQALDRAACLGAEEDCDTVVVYTHREAIVGLLETCCDNTERLATPYCCVGSFWVSVDPKGHCEWKCHAVDDFREFSTQSVADGNVYASPRLLLAEQ